LQRRKTHGVLRLAHRNSNSFRYSDRTIAVNAMGATDAVQTAAIRAVKVAASNSTGIALRAACSRVADSGVGTCLNIKQL